MSDFGSVHIVVLCSRNSKEVAYFCMTQHVNVFITLALVELAFCWDYMKDNELPRFNTRRDIFGTPFK
jgi:hypothetical protein